MSRKPIIASERAKAVGIWLRVSTDEQAQGDSPAVHEKRARLYAESKGWEVREVYHLEGVSGKGVAEHPETKRMLADIRSKRITGLIFSKLARLARNTRELLDFSDEFRAHDADLISLQEAIDTSTPAGRLFYTLIAAMAQWEREEIASRVAASVPIRAKLGKPLGGKPPFGYRIVGGKLEPDPKEAPIRKLAYELYLEHRRLLPVANALNARGYRSTAGKKFSRQSIMRMIQDPSAKGLHRVNYTSWDGEKVVLKPESEWVYHPVEPIVSADVWEAANKLFTTQRAARSHIGRRALHLFTGVCFCHCGHKMYVGTKGPRYRCWTCNNGIPTADLETIYHEQLKGYLFSDEQIARHLQDTDTTIREREERVAHLAGERERLTREMDRVYQLYVAEEISKEGFGTRYRPLEERAAALDEELPAAQAALDVLRIQRLSHDAVLADARNLYERWPELSFEEKRAIVEAITKRITIGEDTVDIELHYAPDEPPGEEGERGNSPIRSTGYAASRNSDKKGSQLLGLVRGPMFGTLTTSNGPCARTRSTAATVSASSSSTINFTSSASSG